MTDQPPSARPDSRRDDSDTSVDTDVGANNADGVDSADDGRREVRRRALYGLGLLALVAALLAVLLVVFTGNGPHSRTANVPGPLDSVAAGPPGPSGSSAKSNAPRSSSSSSSSSSGSSGSSSSSSSSSSAAGPSTRTCPGTTACALQGDPGGLVGAVNAYRSQHGTSAATGTVSALARDCALSNGSHCSGAWAETQVSSLDGQAAVVKLQKLKDLLEPGLRSFAVGWALDPGSKAYFVAFIGGS